MASWSSLARSARTKTGLTQKAFAEVIGASRASVGAWEAGLREPSRLTLSLLCLIDSYGRKAMSKLPPCHDSIRRSSTGRA